MQVVALRKIPTLTNVRERSSFRKAQLTSGRPTTAMSISRPRPKAPKKDDGFGEDFDDFEPIIVTWTDDYDIVALDTKIRKYLALRFDRNRRINDAIQLLQSKRHLTKSPEELSKLEAKIDKLQLRMRDVDDTDIIEYVVKAASIIRRYHQCRTSKMHVFGKASQETHIRMERADIIQEFITLAQRWYPIANMCLRNGFSKCQECGGKIVKKEDAWMCGICFAIAGKYEVNKEYTSTEETETKTNKQYHSGENFRDFVLKFEGKYQITFPSHVIQTIKDDFAGYKNFDITTLTKQDLYKTMRKYRLRDWYDHLNAIYYILTGKLPPDFTEYEENLFKRGRLLENIYDRIKPPDRTNFLHGPLLLWVFLLNEGGKPNKADFIGLKGRDVEIKTLAILEKGFEILRETNPEMKWVIYQIS